MNFIEIIKDDDGRCTLYECNGIASMVVGYADSQEEAEKQAQCIQDETGMQYTSVI